MVKSIFRLAWEIIKLIAVSAACAGLLWLMITVAKL